MRSISVVLTKSCATGWSLSVQVGNNRCFLSTTNALPYEMQDVFADGTLKPSTETLKFTPLPRLLELLREAGLEVANRYQNWLLEPFREGSAAVVLETRKPF